MLRVAVYSLVGLTLMSAVSFGQASETCRDQAAAEANAWGEGYIERAAPNSGIVEGQVLIITPGRKYYVPSYQLSGRLTGAAERMRQWNAVYNEQYWRCMGFWPESHNHSHD